MRKHFVKKKSLGQHFLTNEKYAEMMVEAGEVSNEDTVLEIGPGIGALTKHLLKTGARVIAIEADERAIQELQETFKEEITSDQLLLLHEDIRTFDLSTLNAKSGEYKVIANIPYYISGMLFRLFLTHDVQPSTLVFLVQKEVAERIARSEKESLLSLSIKVFGTPEYLAKVSKGNFAPPPKVDSAILTISNISRLKFIDVNEKLFFELLHIGFQSKRKKLLGNLRASYKKEILEEIFRKLGLDLRVRAEDVGVDNWLELTKEIQNIKSLKNR